MNVSIETLRKETPDLAARIDSGMAILEVAERRSGVDLYDLEFARRVHHVTQVESRGARGGKFTTDLRHRSETRARGEALLAAEQRREVEQRHWRLVFGLKQHS